MAILSRVEGFFIRRKIEGYYKAMSNDAKTTLLGLVLGALTASNLDWGKLVSGDKTQVKLAVGAVVVTAFGYLTNKVKGAVTKK